MSTKKFVVNDNICPALATNNNLKTMIQGIRLVFFIENGVKLRTK
jgi:hypothetical protein